MMMDSYSVGAGPVVSDFRQQHGMSQIALAQVSGLTPEHIRAIESGREAPTLGVMIRLANIFNIQVSAFFDSFR